MRLPFLHRKDGARSGARRNRRREARRPARRLRLPALDWKRASGIAAVLVALAGAFLAVRASLDQPITRIAVEGRFQRVAQADVERAVLQVSRDKGLVAVDLDAVRFAVEELPWVDRASVRRSFPRGLTIFVVEQSPVARWGETGLLNVRGELFDQNARHIPSELPELSGPPGTHSEVTRRYLAAQGRLIEAGMRLTAVRLDARGSWELRLDNGVTLRLGRRQVDERFERFVAGAARLVGQRAGDIDYVDLRYTNGFAVGWRTTSSGKGAARERGRG